MKGQARTSRRSGILLGATLAVLAAGAAGAAPFRWCEVPDIGLTENDQSRLGNLMTSRTRGLAAALRAESLADREVVADLFDPGVPPPDAQLMAGDYRCRTIKLGGDFNTLVVYQWFSCKITDNGDGSFDIRKLTGSQNFAGTLQKAGFSYAFKGASFYGYEDGTIKYGENEERNLVGCFSAVTKGNKHFILELPFPLLESFHDVIEFQPKR